MELLKKYVGLKTKSIIVETIHWKNMIEETYTLNDIMLFLQRQMMDNFNVIEALVNLMDFEYLSDEEKRKEIVETLQRYGLYEIGYKGNRDFLNKSRKTPLPEDTIPKPEDDIDWNKRNKIEVPMELYNIRLLNAVVQFENIIN